MGKISRRTSRNRAESRNGSRMRGASRGRSGRFSGAQARGSSGAQARRFSGAQASAMPQSTYENKVDLSHESTFFLHDPAFLYLFSIVALGTYRNKVDSGRLESTLFSNVRARAASERANARK